MKFPHFVNLAYNLGMKQKSKPDANQNAARIVGQSTASSETSLPADDVEAAWETWIAGVGNVDTRAKALLRAAFEVGIEVGRRKD